MTAMTSMKATIRNRRINVPAPSDIPDGTEVILTIGTSETIDCQPMPPDEITRVLTAMKTLEPLELPNDVATDLDAWEKRLNQHGIDYQDPSLEEVFS